MAEIVTYWFRFFAYETGILDELGPYRQYGPWVLLAIGALALVLGFRVYRGLFSALLFMLVATVTSILLRGRAPDWGDVVTCFSVLGVTAAFMGLFWHRMGGTVLCALLGACMGWAVWPKVWFVIVCALAAFVMTLNFPVFTIDLMTAGAGAWLLWDVAPGLWPAARPVYILAALAAGFAFQYLTTLRQKLFKKRRPDRMTRWLEEKERERKHAGYADSLSEGN